jgi:hypothetical protein
LHEHRHPPRIPPGGHRFHRALLPRASRREDRQRSAGALLGYFLEEIAPLVYNQAVADVQERLLARVTEVDIDVHEEPFAYWRKFDRAGRK